MRPWLAALALLLLACEPRITEGRFGCDSDDDCPPEMVCRTNVSRCFEHQVDAGPPRDGG